MNMRNYLVVLLSALAFTSLASGAETNNKPAPTDADSTASPASPGTAGAAGQRPNDFFIVFSSPGGEQSKFITFGWNGFAGKLIRWQYNDANRNASFSPSSADTVTRFQTAMGKWSAVCNVTFQYDGPTTSPASLSTRATDGVNVAAWGPLSGNTTGVTYVAASGPSSSGPFTLVEADIIINNAFNPDVDVTMLHEVGHMLGLDHSDVEGTVMAGLPRTPYVSLNALTSDDIAGCQALYGAPPPVSITGSITNGGGVAGVTFCARPSAGVSCTASNAAGSYTCTVPSGWSGTLHSPSVANNRIPPQVFSAVAMNMTRNVAAQTGVPGCNLDVDDNGLIEPGTDGVAIMRRMLGFSAPAFAGLSGVCAANTSPSALFAATTSNYNATGSALTLATTDGQVILRAMAGLTGTNVTNGLGLTREAGGSATNTTWSTLQPWLNSNCAATFAP